MKVYLVNREESGEYATTSIEKAFSSLEKAQLYKAKLEEKYKNSFSFQHGYFYFDIEELEVELGESFILNLSLT